MTDPAENKAKFSVGFREVQESFYDLVGKLEKTQNQLKLAEEREENLKNELLKTEEARAETLQQYKEIKSKYVDIKDKLRSVMCMELAPTPAFRKMTEDSFVDENSNSYKSGNNSPKKTDAKKKVNEESRSSSRGSSRMSTKGGESSTSRKQSSSDATPVATPTAPTKPVLSTAPSKAELTKTASKAALSTTASVAELIPEAKTEVQADPIGEEVDDEPAEDVPEEAAEETSSAECAPAAEE